MNFTVVTIFKYAVQGLSVHSHCWATIATVHLQNLSWNSDP